MKLPDMTQGGMVMTERYAGSASYSFEGFTLDLERGELSSDGNNLHLRPKSFEVLRYLVEHAGRLVGKQELIDAVWGRTVVTEGSLSQCIVDIRRAIGDRRQRLLRTVPRRGFIFEGSVGAAPTNGTAATAPSPPGESATRPVDGPAVEQHATPVRAVRFRLAFIALLGLTVLAAVGWSLRPERPPAPATPDTAMQGAPATSIAVLRFADLSPEGDQAWFADGLAEELLNLLAQSPDLRVTARGSSFAFDPVSADVASVADQLGVSHVIEGSVRRDGDALRVTVQLIDARTQTHIWSRSYDRTMAGVLDVQSEIAGDVASILAVEFERPRSSTSTQAAAAEEAYLLGRHLFNRRADGDLASAEQQFVRAVEFDPQHARAWTALAGAIHVRGYDELQDPGYRLEEQRTALERALAVEPEQGEALVRLSRYYRLMGDAAAADATFERARQVAPDSPLVIVKLQFAAAMDGRFDEAVALAHRVVDLDPLSAMHRLLLSHMLIAAGRYEEALVELQRVDTLAPGRPETPARLARALLLLDRADDARQAIVGIAEIPLVDQMRVMLADPAEASAAYQRLRAVDSAECHFLLAEISARHGDLDAAFESLAAARLIVRLKGPRETFQLRNEIALSPFLGPLRADPRWKEFEPDLPRA